MGQRGKREKEGEGWLFTILHGTRVNCLVRLLMWVVHPWAPRAPACSHGQPYLCLHGRPVVSAAPLALAPRQGRAPQLIVTTSPSLPPRSGYRVRSSARPSSPYQWYILYTDTDKTRVYPMSPSFFRGDGMSNLLHRWSPIYWNDHERLT
jgi:hypothetical protein